MNISNTGLETIKSLEGVRLQPYICPAGILSIGYGHTKNVTEKDEITLKEAEALLMEDLNPIENEINRIPNLSQCQYDALVSFCFNIGTQAFLHSTLRRLAIINPNDPQIRNEFRRWVYYTVNGRKAVSKGLKNRREIELELYFSNNPKN